jgi:hypothetical protein
VIQEQTRVCIHIGVRWLLTGLVAGFSLPGPSGSAYAAADTPGVEFEIGAVSQRDGSLHWKIRNRSDGPVYVYDVFLLGPAFRTEHQPGLTTFDTTPVEMFASCPPNRFLPPLLIVVRSGGSIEGDFSDPQIRALMPGSRISLRIAIGREPDSVAAEWQHFLNSDCKHSPYDAVVRWATLVESNVAQL